MTLALYQNQLEGILRELDDEIDIQFGKFNEETMDMSNIRRIVNGVDAIIINRIQGIVSDDKETRNAITQLINSIREEVKARLDRFAANISNEGKIEEIGAIYTEVEDVIAKKTAKLDEIKEFQSGDGSILPEDIMSEETEEVVRDFEEEIQESENDNPNLDEMAFASDRREETRPQQYYEPLTPEEMKALLGGMSKQEDGELMDKIEEMNFEGEQEKNPLPKQEDDELTDEIEEMNFEEEQRKDLLPKKESKVISWLRTLGEKLTGWRKKKEDTDFGYMTPPKEFESDAGRMTEEDFYLNFEENNVILDEPENVEDITAPIEEVNVTTDEMLEEKEEKEAKEDSAKKFEEEIHEQKDDETTEQEKPEKDKYDPFQVLTAEQKREMEARVAAIIVEVIQKNFPNGVSENAFVTREAENKMRNEETANKGSFAGEMSKSESAEDLEQRRKEAIEKAELKRNVKQMVKENEILEFQGYQVTDLPSRFIIAEYKLTGKIPQRKPDESTNAIITTVDGTILKVDKEGNVTIGDYSKESQSPFEVAKNEQAQIGLGQRRRSAGMER